MCFEDGTLDCFLWTRSQRYLKAYFCMNPPKSTILRTNNLFLEKVVGGGENKMQQEEQFGQKHICAHFYNGQMMMC